MTRTTTGWTDASSPRWGEQHAIAALALVAAAVAGLLAAADPAAAAVAVLVAVVVTAVLPLGYDGFMGLLVGLLAAAGLVGAKQLAGAWTPASFWRSLLTTLLLLLLGWAAGRLGKRLRAGGRAAPASQDVAAFGSLGLVHEAAALARLEEEATRAERHRRPLSLLLVRTSVIDSSIDPPSAAAAQRVTARQLEAALRLTDVPFALSPDVIGAILPETAEDGAWEVVGSVLERAADATFTDRARRMRLRLGDHAELAAGIASAPGDGREAGQLLAAALASLDAGLPAGTPDDRPVDGL